MRHADGAECPRASRCHHAAEYGFARGGPVPVEPALLAKRSQGWRERGQHRASGGQDARSERPARWHGLAPSLGGCDRGLGGLVVNVQWSSGDREGPTARLRSWGSQGSFGGDGGSGGLAVNAWLSSEAGSPNGPPSPRLAPGGFYGRGWRMFKSRWHAGDGYRRAGLRETAHQPRRIWRSNARRPARGWPLAR